MENIKTTRLTKFQNKNTKQIKLFKKLYNAHIQELKYYSPRLREEGFTYDDMMKVIFNKSTDIFFINYGDDVVGFVIVGVQYPEIHPDVNYSICEIYVLPEYRRRKAAENTVRHICKKYKGTMCLYILRDNVTAKLFWNSISKKFKFEDISETYTNLCTPSDCIFKVYKVPAK